LPLLVQDISQWLAKHNEADLAKSSGLILKQISWSWLPTKQQQGEIVDSTIRVPFLLICQSPLYVEQFVLSPRWCNKCLDLHEGTLPVCSS